MARYLFIDGGFLNAMILKASEAYGLELSPLALDYRAMTGGFERTFYYDSWPSRKNETEEEYKAVVAQKQKLFDRINRTPLVHTREGVTRSRSPKKKTPLEQKGVDVLLAIDVFKHATLRNITQAHIMATDLDFFPLLEALRDTPVTAILHCFTSETSDELMSLADAVTPITPFTVLKWFHVPDRGKFVQQMPAGEIEASSVFKEGTCLSLPYYIYKDTRFGEQPYFGRSMAIDSMAVGRSARWEHIVWEFEDKHGYPVYFERSEELQ